MQGGFGGIMTAARCNYCRKSDVAPLFQGMERNSTCDERFEVVQCNSCGLVFTYPQATGEQLAEVYDVMLGSRILGKGALKGGMPLYKYIAN